MKSSLCNIFYVISYHCCLSLSASSVGRNSVPLSLFCPLGRLFRSDYVTKHRYRQEHLKNQET
jgi:hypothetical protein